MPGVTRDGTWGAGRSAFRGLAWIGGAVASVAAIAAGAVLALVFAASLVVILLMAGVILALAAAAVRARRSAPSRRPRASPTSSRRAILAGTPGSPTAGTAAASDLRSFPAKRFARGGCAPLDRARDCIREDLHDRHRSDPQGPRKARTQSSRRSSPSFPRRCARTRRSCLMYPADQEPHRAQHLQGARALHRPGGRGRTTARPRLLPRRRPEDGAVHGWPRSDRASRLGLDLPRIPIRVTSHLWCASSPSRSMKTFTSA